ncbi:PTS sugar transporter subunit IIBC [Romboutsia sedimentorum]|uniref:PTS sugar transporter subunit IIBC n=1 Tax=Romboutsia sedimentorum TaxID=1368474 RepID=A0ABT7EA16_9FIRM|nr:PTS sugar transporter subunit IIBC [Romboutsia sedimentorum]MDK2563775.1 PTS sugar transporter subunit IIBC [Romboutsia sedimentorum]
MNKNIVAVCENEASAKALQESGKELGFNIKCEIQNKSNIQNEISAKEISESATVLFVISYEVEDIQNIERFIDREYYEVEPKFVIDNAKAVLKEISSELN